MVEFTTIRAFHKLHRSFKHVFLALLYIVFVILVGVLGYTHFEGLSPFNALYFSVVTLSTIGYGDMYPVTHSGKVFTLFFIPLGVSAFFYAFSVITMALFEGRVLEVLKLEQAKDELKKMRDHVVLCGFGDVGEQVARNLKSVVVIEATKERYEELVREGFLGVLGDSTKPETLREAGVERARALILALNEDPKTVFAILTAKEVNPNIKIYARANRKDSVGKMKQAGADQVICLPELGGKEFIKALEGG